MGRKWRKRRKQLIGIMGIIGISIILYGCNNKSETVQANGISLVKQMKTKHFELYSDKSDKSCLKDLADELENNYDSITNNLKVHIKNRVNIQVYPDIKSLHIAMNNSNASDGVVGTGWGEEIKIVSPLNPGTIHNYDSIKGVLVHEFVHVVISNINNDLNTIPYWLNEGIATYEAKQINDNIRDFIKQKVNENKIPNLERLVKTFDSSQGDYFYSYTLVEFLVNKYGYDKLVDIINKPSDIEHILGVSTTEFEEQWTSFLKENYS